MVVIASIGGFERSNILLSRLRWIDQIDMMESLPRNEEGGLTNEVFWAIAEPMVKPITAIIAKNFFINILPN